MKGGTFGRYVSSGHIIYFDGNGTVFAQPFDLPNRRSTGAAFPVEEGVRVSFWTGGAGSLAISETGPAAFVLGSNNSNGLLQWIDRSGRVLGQVGPALTSGAVRLSPDGSRLATWIHDPSNADVWLMNAATGERNRLTFGPEWNWYPVWSPDGQRILYTKTHGLVVRDLADTEERFVLSPAAAEVWGYSWSSDGEWVTFAQVSGTNQRNLYVVNVDSLDVRRVVSETSADEHSGYFSPDGRYIAFQSDNEVYVVSFPEFDQRQQVSLGGGSGPRWSREGGDGYRSLGFGRTGLIAHVKRAAGAAAVVPIWS